MKLHDLRPAPGAHTRKTRVGRGIAAGKGKTAGRGTKGQKARAGASIPAWFEGGQTPIHIRVPKLRGFQNRGKIEYQVVNVGRSPARRARRARLGDMPARPRSSRRRRSPSTRDPPRRRASSARCASRSRSSARASRRAAVRRRRRVQRERDREDRGGRRHGPGASRRPPTPMAALDGDRPTDEAAEAAGRADARPSRAREAAPRRDAERGRAEADATEREHGRNPRPSRPRPRPTPTPLRRAPRRSTLEGGLDRGRRRSGVGRVRSLLQRLPRAGHPAAHPLRRLHAGHLPGPGARARARRRPDGAGERSSSRTRCSAAARPVLGRRPGDVLDHRPGREPVHQRLDHHAADDRASCPGSRSCSARASTAATRSTSTPAT